MNTPLPHYIEHIIIGIIIQFTIWVIFGSLLWGAIGGSLFYTLREIHQYFNEGKTHKGRFDWEGCVPVIIVTFSIYLTFNLI